MGADFFGPAPIWTNLANGKVERSANLATGRRQRRI
jgi:hypothetical protein